MSRPVYVTTSIPYVNGAPHLGHALEFVLADALARHHRLHGVPTRLQSGTDDNSLNNVLAAEREGVPVRTLVARNSRLFEELLPALDVAVDGFIRTSVDPGHAEGVAAIWQACEAGGDLYRKHYRGLYCVGCEQFYTPAELAGGRCPEHGTPAEIVEEENWFFRLSRYEGRVRELIESGRLAIVPETRRREALAFVASGLQDFSVSRSRARARGWGIAVPGDLEQVIYVWFDALVNYLTALGYPRLDGSYRTFWKQARTIQVIGKGILRFHAVYWPAILLSAGLPPPDQLLVHGYLLGNGAKLSKSSGVWIDPDEIAGRLGVDTLRHWLLRALGPGEDADWTEERALDLRRAELANELGNLLQRTVTLIRRSGGVVPAAGGTDLAAGLEARVHEAVDCRLDPQAALVAIWEVVRAANRYAAARRPWHLAGAERDGVVGDLAEALHAIGRALRPFLPATAGAISDQLGAPPDASRAAGAAVAEPRPLFPRPPASAVS
jgi:methionyl-tRNA synthetase